MIKNNNKTIDQELNYPPISVDYGRLYFRKRCHLVTFCPGVVAGVFNMFLTRGKILIPIIIILMLLF